MLTDQEQRGTAQQADQGGEQQGTGAAEGGLRDQHGQIGKAHGQPDRAQRPLTLPHGIQDVCHLRCLPSGCRTQAWMGLNYMHAHKQTHHGASQEHSRSQLAPKAHENDEAWEEHHGHPAVVQEGASGKARKCHHSCWNGNAFLFLTSVPLMDVFPN